MDGEYHRPRLVTQEELAGRLESVVTQARRDGFSHFVLLTFDLDGFTAISASYGGEAANRLLVAVGERLAAGLHPLDSIARFGCDEFCVLRRCANDGPLDAIVYERIQHQLAEPFEIEGRQIAVSVSVGIARVHPQHRTGAEVFRDAYAAVHHAKTAGGNQCTHFDAGMHEATRARLELEAELRRAFERREFVLYYQPIVCALTKKLVSLEALIRWNHPTRGCLPPSAFLDVLLTTTALGDVGRWIIEEVCRQIKCWRESPLFDAYVSVNVSPRQLMEPGFVSDITQILANAQVSPNWIAIEITEDLVLGDGEASVDVLNELREHGITVRIDDFGTGYSSLSYLRRLPIDGLKIDRAFLEQCDSESHRREIVGAIIRLAHVLGLDVVAEGVENIDQLDDLRRQGCDLVQGYLFSPALPANGIIPWVESERRRERGS